MSLSRLRELVKEREAWCAAVPWGRKELDMTEQLNNNPYLSLKCLAPLAGWRAACWKQIQCPGIHSVLTVPSLAIIFLEPLFHPQALLSSLDAERMCDPLAFTPSAKQKKIPPPFPISASQTMLPTDTPGPMEGEPQCLLSPCCVHSLVKLSVWSRQGLCQGAGSLLATRAEGSRYPSWRLLTLG